MYKKFFNKIYDKFTLENENINEHFNTSLELLEEALNKALYELYNESGPIINNNFENNKPPKQIDNIIPPKNIPDPATNNNLLIKDELNHLNKIQSELQKILKDNYKLQNNDDCNSLSRGTSEAVLILKEELFDYGKRSPIVNLEEFNSNQGVNTNEIYIGGSDNDNDYGVGGQNKILIEIESTMSNILALIKKIYDKTKPPETSSKYYIINQHIYFS
jgi:hypothetical protein